MSSLSQCLELVLNNINISEKLFICHQTTITDSQLSKMTLVTISDQLPPVFCVYHPIFGVVISKDIKNKMFSKTTWLYTWLLAFDNPLQSWKQNLISILSETTELFIPKIYTWWNYWPSMFKLSFYNWCMGFD